MSPSKSGVTHPDRVARPLGRLTEMARRVPTGGFLAGSLARAVDDPRLPTHRRSCCEACRCRRIRPPDVIEVVLCTRCPRPCSPRCARLCTEWTFASSLATKRAQSDTPWAPTLGARSGVARHPSADPARGEHGDGARAPGRLREELPDRRGTADVPPASTPAPMTASTPAAAAASASSSEPT